ncbi:uncharacterized protein [Lolium perenne]|jgi:uncharacterized membrane protein YgcG|uniref:uncharacterized protein n=1 Tax=Lolium perenne TaxID=4522 RepID=UPI0021E9F5E3|nr:uncharacterized protein LOC127323620 [Lolium perenne]
MEEEASAELISPRISFSHDLATFAATATTCPTTPSRSDTSSFLMSRRRRRLPAEPEFDFANAAAADVAPADRLFADGKLLPVPPLPPTPHARLKQPQPPAWQKTTRPPAVRSWGSPFARSSSVNSATTATSGGRFTCPAFPLMRSQSAGAGHRPHCKKVAPATATAAAPGVHSGGGGGGRSVYYYGYGGGGSSRGGGGVRVSPVLSVTSIGSSVVNMLSYLLCDCGEIKGAKSRGIAV